MSRKSNIKLKYGKANLWPILLACNIFNLQSHKIVCITSNLLVWCLLFPLCKCEVDTPNMREKLCSKVSYDFLIYSMQIPRKYLKVIGARSRTVGWGTMLQTRRSQVRVPMRSLDFFNLPNPSSLAMALGSTQPLTEMSTRKIRGG
jgi:hypothetical protein